MAGAALDSLLDPTIIEKAKAEFTSLSAGHEYKPGIPDEVAPPQPTKYLNSTPSLLVEGVLFYNVIYGIASPFAAAMSESTLHCIIALRVSIVALPICGKPTKL